MKKNLTHVVVKFFLFIIFISNNKTIAQVNSLSENFDAVDPTGWTAINLSTAGGLGWYQGDVRQFSSFSGVTNSYAAANYQSVGPRIKDGTISNWLITPELNLSNGSAFSFYTRTIAGSTYPDKLEVRLSVSGSSTYVGNNEESTGDFSKLLLSINPSLELGGYPDTGWTKYDVIVTGIGNISGRVAFRYYVIGGGSNGDNSNYIGIDEFSYETVLPVSLLNFSGVVKDKKAVLSWSTGEELNNKGFEVQVSHDNRNFSSIGFVAADNSKSTGIKNYSFTDIKMLSGYSFYRLKQIDMDGRYKYSGVVKLELKKFDWVIFGNPSPSPAIQLQTEVQSNVTVRVIAANGKIIQTINKGLLPAGTINIPLNLNNAAKGIYIVRLSVDDNTFSKEIMKQ